MLYYLDLIETDFKRLSQVFTTKGSQEVRKCDNIWVRHKHLKHASYGYIKKLFPNVFHQIDPSTLYYDIREHVNIS